MYHHVVTTSTASLYLTVADSVPPSDLSNVDMFQSILVIVAAPREVVKSLIATRTSGSAFVLSLLDV